MDRAQAHLLVERARRKALRILGGDPLGDRYKLPGVPHLLGLIIVYVVLVGFRFLIDRTHEPSVIYATIESYTAFLNGSLSHESGAWWGFAAASIALTAAVLGLLLFGQRTSAMDRAAASGAARLRRYAWSTLLWQQFSAAAIPLLTTFALAVSATVVPTREAFSLIAISLTLVGSLAGAHTLGRAHTFESAVAYAIEPYRKLLSARLQRDTKLRRKLVALVHAYPANARDACRLTRKLCASALVVKHDYALIGPDIEVIHRFYDRLENLSHYYSEREYLFYRTAVILALGAIVLAPITIVLFIGFGTLLAIPVVQIGRFMLALTGEPVIVESDDLPSVRFSPLQLTLNDGQVILRRHGAPDAINLVVSWNEPETQAPIRLEILASREARLRAAPDIVFSEPIADRDLQGLRRYLCSFESSVALAGGLPLASVTVHDGSAALIFWRLSGSEYTHDSSPFSPLLITA